MGKRSKLEGLTRFGLPRSSGCSRRWITLLHGGDVSSVCLRWYLLRNSARALPLEGSIRSGSGGVVEEVLKKAKVQVDLKGLGGVSLSLCIRSIIILCRGWEEMGDVEAVQAVPDVLDVPTPCTDDLGDGEAGGEHSAQFDIAPRRATGVGTMAVGAVVIIVNGKAEPSGIDRVAIENVTPKRMEIEVEIEIA